MTNVSDNNSREQYSSLLHPDIENSSRLTFGKDEEHIKSPPSSRWFLQREQAIYSLAFFFSMIIHELALEAISNSFPHLEFASSVTLFQFGFCFALPFTFSRKDVIKTFPKSIRELIPYISTTILVFGATALSTQSLKYVTYPTKVVFKSAKLIPTMIVSTCILKGVDKKRYGPLDYLSATLLCLGAAGYSYGGGSQNNDESNGDSYYGIILLTISIICDALVPNFQKQLMVNRELSAGAVMVNVNAVGFLVVLIGTLLSGSLVNAIIVALANPSLLYYLILVGLGLSCAVYAYTKLIKASGPVFAVAVATLRKVVTVFLSYIFFPKDILPIHIISSIFVLAGIMISTFKKK